jgi:chorismate dehydratase
LGPAAGYPYFCAVLHVVRISIVNYTNTLPFKWALRRHSLLSEINLQEDIPSICAQKLKYGQVDLALVPVALLPELEHYFIETDFCIGAVGAVESVKLYSRVPLEDIRQVVLDYQSRSSIALTRVLFRFFWQKEVRFVEALPGFEDQIDGDSAAVVIGDRTFALNGAYPFEYDLAEEWQKFTGLPFVFAAWVSTKKLNPEFIERFNDVLKSGVLQIPLAIREDFIPGLLSPEKTLDYLSNKISYQLDSEKRKGLQLFLDYIKKL